MRRAGSLRARRAASAEVRPKLHAALVEFLAGGTDDSLFRSHIRTHPTEIAESILLFQTTVAGSARDRLCDLALDLGLVHDGTRSAASRDLVRRRAAFANLAFASSYEPCRRVAGDLLLRARRTAIRMCAFPPAGAWCWPETRNRSSTSSPLPSGPTCWPASC